ncbi:MAG: UMP kinase [Bacteroidales bacterium]|nr:UMP kinase [Bacteroidales bacterium]
MEYKRVLLKLSGEAMGGTNGMGLNEEVIESYASQIATIVRQGVQVAIVIGGGNIFRGLKGADKGYDRVKGDTMGMLATVINSLALATFVQKYGVETAVFTSLPMEPVANYYMRDKAIAALEEGKVVFLSGGTGNPFFTTDSAAALRALELNANVVLKGTKVDGVYDSDPVKNPDAVKYASLTFDKALADGLKVMDSTAFALCKENDMPIIVFNMNIEGMLQQVVNGHPVGTIVSNKE